MSSEITGNGFNKEYIYVRRLISVLTNDDSDKMIVEKLKGKNLSSLLYNAKIIDNSKNMATNKRILGCVIRAIEREKHMCRRKDLDQSWGRKLLSSFNCLIPIRPYEMHSDESSFNKEVTDHSGKDRQSRRKQCISIRRTVCKNVNKKCGRFSSKSFSETSGDRTNRSISQNFDDPNCVQPKQCHVLRCTLLTESKSFETVHPINLSVSLLGKTDCLYFDNGRAVLAKKKSSATQTFNTFDGIEPNCCGLPNNMKLQHLLDAASSLINTQDQREYVKTFLSNFEPPFDLSSGLPAYLKLPMEPTCDKSGKESIYGSSSEISFLSGRMLPSFSDRNSANLNITSQQMDTEAKKIEQDFNFDAWQDTAESIISGVINESLPHEKADYSQLGACILKRLGAFPSGGYRDHNAIKQNSIIPEIVLSSTEWFENDTGETENKPQPIIPKKSASIESIVEIKLVDTETERSKMWEYQRLQNFCFYDSSTAEPNNPKIDLLNLSDISIADVPKKYNYEKCQETDHFSYDRNDFLHREPLTISPSILNEGGELREGVRGYNNKTNVVKPLKVHDEYETKEKGDFNDCQNDVHLTKCMESVTQTSVILSQKSGKTTGEPRQVEIVTETIANVSLLLPDEQNQNSYKIQAVLTNSVPEILETEITQPTEPKWSPSAIDVETFDGLGECNETEKTSAKIEKKTANNKNQAGGLLQNKFRDRKKCKSYKKPKKLKNGKDDAFDLSRNCKVM